MKILHRKASGSPVRSRSGLSRPLLCVASLILFASTIVPFSLFAQSGEPADTSDSSELRAWLFVGLGPSTAGEFPGLTAAVTAQRERHTLSLRGAVGGELFGDEYWDLGILYGLGTRLGEDFSLSGGVGLAATGGSWGYGLFGPPRETMPIILAFPLEAQFSYHPFSFLGIGLYGYADVNRRKSFGGVSIGVQVGMNL